VFATTKPGEEIHYFDITSLYPSVNACFNNRGETYPIGMPKKITNFNYPLNQLTEKYIEKHKDLFGYVKCKVLPPQDLYIPVLPIKIERDSAYKLMFPLCRHCAIIEEKGDCIHTVEERALIGTWTTLELNKALEKGYKLLCIYEAHHFEHSSDKLFAKYIFDFLKIKQEASGLPSEYPNTPEGFVQYVNDYYQQMGIYLDVNKIKYNPGLRFLAKLCLNSLWGKFAQRDNLPTRAIVNKRMELEQIIDNPSNIDIHTIFESKQLVELNYKKRFGTSKVCRFKNIHLATFTTSMARIRLYEALDKLGDRVLYFDTDSVIFKIDTNQNEQPSDFVEISNKLGEWTNELKPGYQNFVKQA